MRRVLAADERPLHWVGSSKRDFLSFPAAVKDDMGNALGIAQVGGTAPTAKPWKGLGSGVLEVVESHDGNAYRAAYTVRFERGVYVLRVPEEVSIRHPDGQAGCRSCCGAVENRCERLRGTPWQAKALKGKNR